MSLLEILGGLWNLLVRACVCNFSEGLAGSLWCLFVALQVLWCQSSKASVPSCTQMPPAIRGCGLLISAPHQVRQIPFLCVAPWKASGAPESLSTLLSLSPKGEKPWVMYVPSPSHAKSRGLQDATLLYLWSQQHSDIHTVPVPTVLQVRHGRSHVFGNPPRSWSAGCTLYSPSWRKSQRPGVLAWHWAVVAEESLARGKWTFFLSVSVQLFSALCSLRVLQLLN